MENNDIKTKLQEMSTKKLNALKEYVTEEQIAIINEVIRERKKMAAKASNDKVRDKRYQNLAKDLFG